MAGVEDVAPALLEQIQADFQNRIKNNKNLQELLELVNTGKATFRQAQEAAYEMGEALSQAFGNCLSSAVLPDGKMYYNIAQRVVAPMLGENHRLIANVAARVQAALNKKANIGLKAQTAPVDEDRIKGIVELVTNADQYDDVAGQLPVVVENFCRNVVDETIRANVDFQGKAGLRPKVIRKATRKCCEWCQALAGEYDYPMVPDDIYRRHGNCRCLVEYDPGTGKRQKVHTKQWNNAADRDKIEARKRISASGASSNRRGKDNTVADAIASGEVKDQINRERQSPHGEPPKEGRSYLYGSVDRAEELFQKLKTTGTAIFDSNGNWTHKERVVNDSPVGVWVSKDGKAQETKGAMIVYSKTGSHIYPRKEE